MSNEPPEVVPLLRGLLHAYAIPVAVAAAVVLGALAPPGRPRVAALVYGTGLCALFAVSALYHRWRWDPRWRPLLQRLDHSTIFVFIAASTTPVALLVLSGPLQVAVLVTAWAAAIAGTLLSVAWITAPRWLVAAAYLAAGWAGVLGVPQVVERLGLAPVALLAAGGGLYTAGALVYAARWPDPWPRLFGFHEVFHVLVIAAAGAHFAAMAGWIVPSGA